MIWGQPRRLRSTSSGCPGWGAHSPVVELEADARPPLPEPVREGSRVFPVSKETLHNALRHRRTRHLHIRLAWQESKVIMAVYDNGQGFLLPSRPGRCVAAGRLGLASRYERAAMLGGELQIATAAGAGTTVTLAVPGPNPAAPWPDQRAAPAGGGVPDDWCAGRRQYGGRRAAGLEVA